MKSDLLNKKKLKGFFKIFRHILKYIVFSFGIFTLFLLLLSFSNLPFWLYYWLGTSNSEITQKPAFIILLSGSGMPSESGLIRTYFTAQLSESYPDAKIIIAMPDNQTSSTSAAGMIKNELIIKGIKNHNIYFEKSGTNTRSQALNISSFFKGSIIDSSVVIVTSPEHMYRAILTFRKAGFKKVGGYPTFENTIPADITFNDKKLGGRTVFIPKIGKNLTFRYQFWNHLKYELIVLREYAAISFYWIKGWI